MREYARYDPPYLDDHFASGLGHESANRLGQELISDVTNVDA